MALNTGDYWGNAPGGATFEQDKMELMKALSTGFGVEPSTQIGAGALRRESLQATLKSVTFRAAHAVLWQKIGKVKAYSTIEEYVRFEDPGDAQFYVEGGLPEEHDAILTRQFEKVKFMGTVGKISNVAKEVRNVVGAKAAQIQARTLALLGRMEKALYFADEGKEALAFNGLVSAVENRADDSTVNIIDLEGERLTLEDVNQGARVILDRYGLPSMLLLSNEAKQGFVNEMIKSKTYFVNDPSTNRVGINPDEWSVASARGAIFHDVFLRTNDPHLGRKNASGTVIKTEGQPPTTATSTKAPAVPVAGVAASSPVDATSKLAAGTYDYKITACNSYGESTALSIDDLAVTAGDNGTLPIVEGGGPYIAESYKVYRKLDADSIYYFCFMVSKTVVDGSDATADGASGTILDRNFYRPQTTTGILLDPSPDQVLAVHQLLPYFYMQLPALDDSERWLQKIYVNLMVYNPNKIVIYRNIGTTTAT